MSSAQLAKQITKAVIRAKRSNYLLLLKGNQDSFLPPFFNTRPASFQDVQVGDTFL